MITGQRLENSSAMVKEAVAEGITQVLATPPYKNEHWTNKKDVINQQFKISQQELNNRDISFMLFPKQ